MAGGNEAARGPSTKSSKLKRDEDIMATNNSSIVSKRCVEKLYYPGRQEYFKPFVKKLVRRSPLISRGYWLRMKAVEHVVRCFLAETSNIRKVVINLGCGYDPLPFQCLGESSQICENALFVDVDYPQLMEKKASVIAETPQLRDLLPGFRTFLHDGPIVVRSDTYLGIGCDLRDLTLLRKTLLEQLVSVNCLFLFLAEVSITYMKVEAADAVIAWASQFNQARFCLLEQFLPDGADHPFAQTMLKHFNKLRSPLHSIHKYPLLRNQQERFLSSGWTSVDVQDLWSLWQGDQVIGPEQRLALNAVEPFDEWEELALFGGHYFLLVAKNADPPVAVTEGLSQFITEDKVLFGAGQDLAASLISSHNPTGKGLRRYGAVVPPSGDILVYHGGMGSQGRLKTCDIYATVQPKVTSELTAVCPSAAAPRMCHTITGFGETSALLVGGRASPDTAMADCWLWEGTKSIWQRTDDLPAARYRHCAVGIEVGITNRTASLNSQPSGILVFGGKQGDGMVLDEWLLWQAKSGWRKLELIGQGPEPRFGATMELNAAYTSEGNLTGGIGADGTIISDLWSWRLVDQDGLKIICHERSSVMGGDLASELQFARFGSTLVPSPWGLLLIGGVAKDGVVEQRNEILAITEASGVYRLEVALVGPRPLLVGFGVSNVNFPDKGDIVILSGGAVCFSFGTFWNEGCYTLSPKKTASLWRMHPAYQDASMPASSSSVNNTQDSRVRKEGVNMITPHVTSISRMLIRSDEEFIGIVNRAQPVILEKLDIGACTDLWTPEYLRDQIGADRSVVVHNAYSGHMNFQAKNFCYKNTTFGAFLESINNGERMYLRALSSTGPAEKATHLSQDFPTIASDFHLPPELNYVNTNAHSSPLRISGPVTMWLHYDVMSNVLCQVFGRKRLLLYPPSDVTHLGFPPGASSSTIDVWEADSGSHPSLSQTHPHEAILEPGDVLFIPALWLHTASPTDSVSIAVNVFFRNLKAGYAAGRDVYGNRDLQVYERGRKDIERMLKAFEGLPTDVGRFYLGRLAKELADGAASFG